MLMEILALVTIINTVVAQLKKALPSIFPDNEFLHDLVLRLIGVATAFGSATIVYVSSTPDPTIAGLGAILSFTVLSAFAAWGHYHINKDADGKIVVTPEVTTDDTADISVVTQVVTPIVTPKITSTVTSTATVDKPVEIKVPIKPSMPQSIKVEPTSNQLNPMNSIPMAPPTTNL